jgi:hypothetical protein
LGALSSSTPTLIGEPVACCGVELLPVLPPQAATTNMLTAAPTTSLQRVPGAATDECCFIAAPP